MSERRLLTINEVATEAGVTRQTVSRWLSSGRLRAITPGQAKTRQARKRIRRDDWERFWRPLIT